MKSFPLFISLTAHTTYMQGIVPVAVVATAGTTVLGSIDPLDQVADVCEKHKVWLHVDAAVGGALLFSRKHRQSLAGIER